MHAVIALDLIPTRDALDGGRFVLVDIKQHFSIHVLAHRHAEVVQERGANIEEVSSVDAFVFLNTWSLCNKDTELAMLNGGTGRLAREAGGTQMVRVKAVIGHED